MEETLGCRREFGSCVRIFDEVTDYVLALLAVGFEADVNPEGLGGLGGFLLNELVESQIFHHPCEPLDAGGVIGNVYVNGFTCLVLAVGNSSHGFVQGRTTES